MLNENIKLKTKLHKIKITIKAGFQQDTNGTRLLTCAQHKQFRNHYRVVGLIIADNRGGIVFP